MSLHDELLAGLQRVASVRLIASLRDPRLELGSEDELRVFIPDVHVVSKTVRSRYAYGTNDIGLLTRVAETVRALKVSPALAGKTVAFYQMGDFCDLWRETPTESDRLNAMGRIQQDHPELMRAFFAPELGARFLLGNHDFELCRRANFVLWERRFYLRSLGASRPTGIALHGDLFDWVETTLPNALQRWVVFFMSPRRNATRYEYEAALMLVHAENRRHDFSNKIGGDASLGAPEDPAGGIPARHNVAGSHKFLEDARNMCRRINERDNARLRFAVIGHTHHACIAMHEGPGDDFFALIDTGAWIEACRFPDGTIMPNAQVTAISANEVRIYQLGPRSP